MSERKPFRLCIYPIRLCTYAVVLWAALACKGDPVTPVPSVRDVTVAPKTTSVLVGGTVTVTATVRVDGGADDGVSWSTSDETVATVSNQGIVTGRKVGSVSITATSTFDPTKNDAAGVSVLLGEPATVAIQSVNRGGTLFPVDPGAVAGTVDVGLNVAPGDQLLTRVDLVVDGTVVVSQLFQPSLLAGALGSSTLALPPFPSLAFVSSPSPSPPFVVLQPSQSLQPGSRTTPALLASPFSVVLSFNTGAFNVQTGAPSFLNATHTLAARISTISGIAATASVQLIFSNQNAMVATLSTNGSQGSDGSGRTWVSGDLTATVRPVIYTSGGITLASAVVGFPGLQNKTAAANGVVSWPRNVAVADGGAAGYSNNGGLDALAPVVISSTLSNGAAGPSGQVANAANVAIRLDNRAPHPGVLVLTNQSAGVPCCSGSWVGSAYQFASGHIPPPGDGEGVDGAGVAPTGVTYHVGDPGMTNDQIAALPAVMGSATLLESNFFTAYTVVASVSDRVGNVSLTRLAPTELSPVSTFGVDKIAPLFGFSAAGGVSDGAVNPAALVFATAATDGGSSGFAPQPVAHRILGNFSTSPCFLGGPNCAPVLGEFVIAASAPEGFYLTYEAFVRDQAGNTSPTISRTVLFDHQAPQITAMPVPTLSAAPTLTQFTVSVADNVDLKNAEHRLDFPGANGPLGSLPFAPPALLSTFGAPLVTVQNNVVVSIPFVRSLEQTTAAGVPTGTLQPAEGTRFRVVDLAGNVTNQSALFPGGSVPAGTSATTRNVQSFKVSAPAVPVAICSGILCGSVPQSVSISAEASVPSGAFGNPFSSVYFYWIDATGLTRLIGSSSSPVAQDVQGVFKWTWTISFSAPGAPLQIGVQIFAIGVEGRGDGLRTRSIANVTILEGG